MTSNIRTSDDTTFKWKMFFSLAVNEFRWRSGHDFHAWLDSTVALLFQLQSEVNEARSALRLYQTIKVSVEGSLEEVTHKLHEIGDYSQVIHFNVAFAIWDDWNFFPTRARPTDFLLIYLRVPFFSRYRVNSSQSVRSLL